MAALRRIVNLFRRSEIAREIKAELQAHITLRTDENIARGMSPEEARRDALVRFGNLTSTREHVAGADAALSLESLGADIRFALRQLRRAPGFAAVAILTLALAIGATTAIFSVTNAVLLRPLPYPRANRIFQVEKVIDSGAYYSASVPLFLAWRDHDKMLERVAAYSVLPVGFNLGERGKPDLVPGLRVSADFFRVLGVEPRIGRNFNAGDDREAAARVVVIAESLWHRQYADDPAIVGKQINVNGAPATVIGVMPAAFQFLATQPLAHAIEIWMPLSLTIASRNPANTLSCIGRLRDGATPAQASSELTMISRELARELPPAFPATGAVGLLPLQQRIGEDARPALLLLLVAAGFVLLIACANVANLLSVRMADRAGEISIRTALGAGTRRIVRQLLTESMVLAFAGGAAGLSIAAISTRILLRLAPLSIARFHIDIVDWRVLLFAGSASALTAVLFGVLPALRIARVPAAGSLHASSIRSSRGKQQRKLSGALTVIETALSLVLLAAAGLLIESLMKLERLDLGFDHHRITTFETTLPVTKYAQPRELNRFIDGTRENISRLPDVAIAASVSTLPTEPTLNAPFTVEDGRTLPPDGATGESDELIVSGGYLDAMRIPLLAGRAIDDSDKADSPGVVMINQAFARRFFPGENPVGKRLTVAKNLGPAWLDEPREIIAVVGDVQASLEETASPSMYVPFAQIPDHLAAILLGAVPVRWVVRTRSAQVLGPDELGSAVQSVDSSIAVAEAKPMSALLADALARWKFNMLLLETFGGIALALAEIGLYGVVSYFVSQSTQEIGIRMALGARRGQLLCQVIGKGMTLCLAGTFIGLVSALLLTRLIRKLLFGVSPADPVVMAGAALLLIAIAFIACLIPARRAVSIDPIRALRCE